MAEKQAKEPAPKTTAKPKPPAVVSQFQSKIIELIKNDFVIDKEPSSTTLAVAYLLEDYLELMKAPSLDGYAKLIVSTVNRSSVLGDVVSSQLAEFIRAERRVFISNLIN
jgi:hypothetical protein